MNGGHLFAERDLLGGHIKDGSWALVGTGAKGDVSLDAKIVDLGPTMLYLLRLPIPNDMDGALLRGSLELQRVAQYTDQSIEARRKEEV